MHPAVLFLLLSQAAAPKPAASFDSLAQRAEAARLSGRLDEAIPLYRRALSLRPAWEEGLWNFAGVLYARNDFHDCQTATDALSRRQPKLGPVWSLRGLCDFGAKQYGPALAHLREGQRLGSGGSEQFDREAKHDLAILLTKAGAFEEALGLYYGLAKAGAPADTALLENVGMAALRKPLMPEELPQAEHEAVYLAGKAFWQVGAGQAAKAKTLFEALAGKYPEMPNVHFFYASYLLTNDPEAGLRELQKEIALSPRNLPALVTTAVEFLKRNEPAKALPFAQDAVRYGNDNFASHTVLGRVYLQQGELEKGVAELEQAEKLAPESPQPRIALASAYAKLGRTDDAARERKEFLRLQELAKPPGTR